MYIPYYNRTYKTGLYPVFLFFKPILSLPYLSLGLMSISKSLNLAIYPLVYKIIQHIRGKRIRPKPLKSRGLGLNVAILYIKRLWLKKNEFVYKFLYLFE